MRALILLITLPLLHACGSDADPSPDAGTTLAGTSGMAGAGGDTAGKSGGAGSAAGGGAEDAAVPDSDALCDGSSEMRLVYNVSGGFVVDTFAFTNPRGATFLAIDGTCHYYVLQNYMRGIQSGTLSAADADALARDLHWHDLASWAWDLQKDMACPDASGVLLSRAHVSAGCSCGCDANAPRGLGDALTQAQQWVTRLTTSGKPLEGAVTALAFEGEASGSAIPVMDWPLATQPSAVPNLVHDRSDPKLWQGGGSYARFEGADATKLRDLRSATLRASTITPGFAQARSAGKVYELYVRDELPEATAKAWDALDASLTGKP